MNYSEEEKESIINALSNVKKTSKKNWYSANCPYCGKEEHLGIVFDTRISFNCFRCGEHGSIWKLLKFLGKLFLLKREKLVNIFKPLEEKSFNFQKIEIDEISFETKKKPLGFIKISQNNYLEDRQITKNQISKYDWGFTKIESRLKDYIILILKYNENIIGYIARTTLSDFQIESVEKLTGKKYLRYRNSISTDFSKYLFGIDELGFETKTVIIVEGIFDKLRVDSLLELEQSENLKCVACFGKKISDNQIYLLQNKKIENVIILYDKDAVFESKKYSLELQKFFNVKVGFCTSKDPGALNFNQIIDVFENLQDPINFSISKINKKQLK